MYELTVIVEFEAAHRIVDYPGKCDRLHGHNWSVEVTVDSCKLIYHIHKSHYNPQHLSPGTWLFPLKD